MQTYLLAAKHHPSPIPIEENLNVVSENKSFDESSNSSTKEFLITKTLARTLTSGDNLFEVDKDIEVKSNKSNKSVKTNSQPNILLK